MSRGYVAAAEAFGTQLGRVNWQYELRKPAPANQIGINIRRLGNLAKRAGFGQLTVKGHSGPIPRADILLNDGWEPKEGKFIIGARGDGQLFKVDIEEPSSKVLAANYQNFWPEVTLSINDNELYRLVQDTDVDRSNDYGEILEHRPLNNPKWWAIHLDTALRHGMESAAARHLLSGPSWPQKSLPFAAIAGSVLLRSSLTGQSLEPELADIPIGLLGAQLVTYGNSLMHRLPLSEGRFSVLPGFAVERFLALSAITGATRLAKRIKPT